jgi:hypothetical protein
MMREDMLHRYIAGISEVRDKVYDMLSTEVVEKYLLTMSREEALDRDFEVDFDILEEMFEYLKDQIVCRAREIGREDMVVLFYSILLGVLDVGKELLVRFNEIQKE